MANKKILFLSSVSHLSSMAEGWASKLKEPSWNFISASLTASESNTLPVEAMKEVNIDIADKHSHSFDPHLLKEADVVVAIYDFKHDSKPVIEDAPIKKMISWDIPNPVYCKSSSEKWATYQLICDELAIQVKRLKETLI
ncbi:protein-tyrosine-phosphatase [Bacillus ectoiniformans]|uniref:hypothetical protein n=1 Tax=Bacillus ectoiniformans TaxID=1494429 RepID=UPI001957CA57|nr:hypothetical protein [Bacillus ectoiniformans]MBM7647649.1 protein-tyrosine-phosphatase [Bacillus ectoiniformans]